MTDPRARKILFDTHWTAQGWKREFVTDPDDFAYAKAQGLMFDACEKTHSQLVKDAMHALAGVDPDRVIAAFLASLSTRRLDLRSALGSYAFARHLREHDLVPHGVSGFCDVCASHDHQTIDFNVLNFERLKWGGVRHDQPGYAAFDLERLKASKIPVPTSEDRDILSAILQTADTMPAGSRLGHLDKAIAKLIRSNSAERRCLIAILGFAGVLIDRSRPSFFDRFVDFTDRERTPWHNDDWPYPVQWWDGSHGVNANAVEFWFRDLG